MFCHTYRIVKYTSPSMRDGIFPCVFLRYSSPFPMLSPRDRGPAVAPWPAALWRTRSWLRRSLPCEAGRGSRSCAAHAAPAWRSTLNWHQAASPWSHASTPFCGFASRSRAQCCPFGCGKEEAGSNKEIVNEPGETIRAIKLEMGEESCTAT